MDTGHLRGAVLFLDLAVLGGDAHASCWHLSDSSACLGLRWTDPTTRCQAGLELEGLSKPCLAPREDCGPGANSLVVPPSPPTEKKRPRDTRDAVGSIPPTTVPLQTWLDGFYGFISFPSLSTRSHI